MNNKIEIEIDSAEGVFKAVITMHKDKPDDFELVPVGDAEPKAIPYLMPYVVTYLSSSDPKAREDALFMIKHVGDRHYFPVDYLTLPEDAIP